MTKFFIFLAVMIMSVVPIDAAVKTITEAGRTIKKAIEELAQLNQDHAYSFSRDELVKMLDEALMANP